MAHIKGQVYADLEHGSDGALTDTLQRLDAAFRGPDLADALAARAEKRRPAFTALPSTRR